MSNLQRAIRKVETAIDSAITPAGIYIEPVLEAARKYANPPPRLELIEDFVTELLRGDFINQKTSNIEGEVRQMVLNLTSRWDARKYANLQTKLQDDLDRLAAVDFSAIFDITLIEEAARKYANLHESIDLDRLNDGLEFAHITDSDGDYLVYVATEVAEAFSVTENE